MLMQRLKLLEISISLSEDKYEELQLERESKLAKINSELSLLYKDYQHYLREQEDVKDIEKRIKVEIDYNLIRIIENKLKMD